MKKKEKEFSVVRQIHVGLKMKPNRPFSLVLFRLQSESGGGAWCPRPPVDRRAALGSKPEWLQVDLGGLRAVTLVATQGRFGGGRGVEYAEAYRLQYWRPGWPEGQFKTYRDALGREVSKCWLSHLLRPASQPVCSRFLLKGLFMAGCLMREGKEAGLAVAGCPGHGKLGEGGGRAIF